jgi:hypothetical protein
MTQIFNATFANGVLTPEVVLDVPDNTVVRVAMDMPDKRSHEERLAALKEFNRFCEEHPIRFDGPPLTRD